MNRSATASQWLGNPERKNTPCISDLAGVKFLLKKERVFFFWGSALQVFGQVAEQCGRSFGKTIFWGKDLAKPRLNLSLNSDVANGKGGVWGGIFHLLR